MRGGLKLKHMGMRRRSRIVIKTPEQIEGIRRSSQVTKAALDMVAARIEPGVRTQDLDAWVFDFIQDHGGTPAPLGYNGFPKSICTSVNDVVLHGIPDGTVLKEGDIVNVDVTTILEGYYGDSSRMFCLGEPGPEAKKLVEVTHECMMLGIEKARAGNTVGHIGQACQRHAERNGFSVVREFCGHGVGLDFHEPPEILHFGKNGQGAVLREGMVFTIEPMINAGSRDVRTLQDGWTTVTVDGALSAQWEHTIAITSTGPDILTL